MNPVLKKFIKQGLTFFYSLFNFFYRPYLKRYFLNRLQEVPRTTQLFFVTRFDLGAWLLVMHYAHCWSLKRGDAALVMFTPSPQAAIDLSQQICPKVQIIAYDGWVDRILFRIFRRALMQFHTFNPIYIYAYFRCPHALSVFDMPIIYPLREQASCYISHFDPIFEKPWPFSESFRQAYLKAMRSYDYQRPIYRDMLHLAKQVAADSKTKQNAFNKELQRNLKLDKPYVVINMNCKDYGHPLSNSRRVHFPETHNALIDYLIEKGYQVVIQGREEQPLLSPRDGLIEYFKGPWVSAKNDYALFAGCAFAVLSKTGPEIFSMLCDVPMLGLNYVELAALVPRPRCRFYPKHVRDLKTDQKIHWKQLLQRPCFFNIGRISFEEGIEYIDLTEEEILSAGQEFLELLPKETSQWMEYTDLQQEFKRHLHPAHIDLYEVPEVPCDHYLKGYEQRSYTFFRD